MKKLARTLDVECYCNYFLLIIREVRSGFVMRWELFNGKTMGLYSKSKLVALLRESTIVTFNGLAYDHAIVCGFISGLDNKQLYELSQYMINTELSQWRWNDEWDSIQEITYTHIDIMNVAPGIASLKIYGGRIHHPKLQDLPVPWDKPISIGQRNTLIIYCINDNDVTAMLFKYLRDQLLLRQNLGIIYGIRLMSKSDAQIAEGVIRRLMTDRGVNAKSKQLRPLKVYRYDPPDFIKFESEELQAMFDRVKNAEFKLSSKGSILLPQEVRNVIVYKGKKYQFGIGGLHSKESAVSYPPIRNTFYVDFDVTSYYPSIIITNGYYPKPLTPKFVEVYDSIVQKRIKAKQEGDTVTADSLKIVVNSSFGKFGNQYSSMYDPKLLLQTTITGQLALLMLIEMMESRGVEVISANTDGVMVIIKSGHDGQMADDAVKEWQTASSMSLEDEWYREVYKESVNSYFAVNTDGKIKGKGTYAKASLQKNPAGTICTRAVTDYLVKGIPISTTVKSSTDITEFTYIRTVKGGAVYRGDEVGKSVRWYYQKGETGIITYQSNGNKVPNSNGACLVNRLPSKFPTDIDYDRYIEISNDLLTAVGGGI